MKATKLALETARSRCIQSNQDGMHPKLETIVNKHLNTHYQRPIANHTQQAFDAIRKQVEQHTAPLIFDSCCGTGLSTRHIAQNHPEALVIGIDRSAKRLSKTYSEALPDNARLVQAECADFWRLAQQAQWKLSQHFLLYPNPYPKSSQLKRRWHAHPSYPSLLALGGTIELRTNWLIYAQEFCHTFQIAVPKQPKISPELFTPKDYWTLFEKKYHQSGQNLYFCRLYQ
ncbi:MAG: hypothetical protein KAG28_02665 [Cocleimonas sp.]|nr:hypothetical protein [Cocleimonas sp.]